MLDRKSWETHTAQVTAGRSIRVEHDCGEGRVLKITNGEDGYSAWCFRCNDKGFIGHPAPSLAERLAKLARVRTVEAAVTASVELPAPATTDPQDWPTAARLWLYKSGFSNDDIVRLGFYWCPAIDRVVLPVFEGGVLRYWQARSVSPQHHPKYINPLVNKTALAAKYGTGPCIALTEDILSASRVARVTEAWSIMGTALADGVASQLVETGKPVAVMLDPDKGGIVGTTKALRRLRTLGVTAWPVVSPRDPKYLTKEETLSCLLHSAPSWLHSQYPQLP